MRDKLIAVFEDAENEVGSHPDLTAFVTVRDAFRTMWGSEAAYAYREGAQVILYSDEGEPYTISFASLVDELLMLGASGTRSRLAGRA
ncbi:hypothetical protein [Brachybacterium paraconglomeratum]|uniref:hypothetical protein n=1 Tax=Brachybacterium paraconglomeratum TaxID=173362 RepID=UPI0037F3AD06